jgi:hypothetical protein
MSSGADRASRKGSVGSASGGSGVQTVGTLLAAIATCMAEALRIFMFADKRQWGPDEFEQTRALEAALDEAKKDFQEMAPLVHGQFYYENDRTRLSSLSSVNECHAPRLTRNKPNPFPPSPPSSPNSSSTPKTSKTGTSRAHPYRPTSFPPRPTPPPTPTPSPPPPLT